jgi:hypothetical protein
MTTTIEQFITINGIVAILAGSIGFVIRKIWDTWADRREKTRVLRLTQRIDSLSRALRKFYWPLYFLLCKDIIVWRKNNNLMKKTSKIVQDSIIIPNHYKILKILGKHTYLAEPNAEFKEQILLYTKHAYLYITIRRSGEKNKKPSDYGAPFPMEFVRIIEKNTNELQFEYNSLLGLKHDKKHFLNKNVAKLLGIKITRSYHDLTFFEKVRGWFQKLCLCKKEEHRHHHHNDIERGNVDTIENAPLSENYYNSPFLVPDKGL